MIKKSNKFHALLAVIILLAILVPQYQALAVCPVNISDCAQDASKLILAGVGKAVSWAAQGFDSFVQYQTTSGVFDILAVREGWTQIRNFVNLLFILVLIIMAFGTIFNIQKYTWRDMLPPFLVAALLINFGLAIGQYVITVSNGLAGVFLREMTQGGSKISTIFGQGFSIPGIVTATPELGIIRQTASLLWNTSPIGIIINAATPSTGTLLTAIFGIVFLLIVLLAFLAAFIFSLARIFVLWFLLIISPIAWLGYALPNLRQKTWSSWWNNFLCWCFFLPYYLFFLMFAVIFIRNQGSLPGIPNSSVLSIGTMTLDNLVTYGVSLVFLVYGLILAKKLACASGSGVSAAFGKIETGVRKYAPGAAYVRGGVAGLKERGAEIAEKGVFGIGGAQRARLDEATAKGWVAGVPGPGKVPGAREAAAKAEMVEIEKDGKRIREQLLSLPADQQKAFLEAEKSKKGIVGQAAELEFVKQGYSKLEDYQKATEKYGGENSAFMRQYLENIKQAKLSDLFKSPDEELRMARGEVAGTDGLANLRRELYKDLAKRNRINEVNDYKEAKSLFSSIPAELKSFMDSIKPEYIFGTKEARKEALQNYGSTEVDQDGNKKDQIRDADLAKKLVDYMSEKDKKEITDTGLLEKAFTVVGGKDSFEGKRIVTEINKFNPTINIEAELRQDAGTPTGPLSEADQNKLITRLSEELAKKNIGDIKKFSPDFFKDPFAQESLLKAFEDPEMISAIIKGASPEVRRALPKLKKIADKLAADNKRGQRRQGNEPEEEVEEKEGEEEENQ